MVQITPTLFANWWTLEVHACTSYARFSPHPCLVPSNALPGRETEAWMGNGDRAPLLSQGDAPSRLQQATQQWVLPVPPAGARHSPGRSSHVSLNHLQQQSGVRGDGSCRAQVQALLLPYLALSSSLSHFSHCKLIGTSNVAMCWSGKALQPRGMSLTFSDMSHLQ